MERFDGYNKFLRITSLNTKVVESRDRIIFRPNIFGLFLMGLVYLTLGFALHIRANIANEIVSLLLSFPFVLYGLYLWTIPFFYRAELNLKDGVFRLGTLTGSKKFHLDEISLIVLDRIADSFFLYLETNNKRKALFSLFRGRKAELKGYNLLHRFRMLGFRVKDATSHVSEDYDPKVRDKVTKDGNTVRVRIGFRDLPKSSYVLAGIFVGFGLAMSIAVSDEAPLLFHVILISFSLVVALSLLVLSAGFWKEWKVVDEGDRYAIRKKSFLGILRRKKIFYKKDIIWTVVREYVYRRTGQTLEHKKGFMFKVISPKKTERIGAFLSRKDTEILRSFVSLPTRQR